MKAWVLKGVNRIELEEVPKPIPGKGEVLVQIKAAGICGSDIPRIYQTGAHSHPLIPGHEFAGKVVMAGSEDGQSWIGKRVGIFPLIPCHECGPCQNQYYEMCRNYSYLGSRRDGAFTEYVAAPVNNLIELPEAVSYEEAAMLEPMAVAVHALRRLTIHTEDTVVVCGLGTIGLMLVMFLQEMGVSNVYVIGNKEFQRERVMRAGISEKHYLDCRNGDVESWILQKTCGRGAQVFFECVGKNETVSQAISVAAPAGQVCFVGNPFSDMQFEKDCYWKILRNQLRVTGTWNSSFLHDDQDDWHYVLERLAKKSISPDELITHRFALEDLEQGFHIMRDKSEDYIKILMVSNDG